MRRAPLFTPWPGATLLLAVFLFMAVAVFVDYPLWPAAFRSDSSALAWLSGAQLLAAALLAARLGVERLLPPSLVIVLSAGLAALALDEQFMLHEIWQYGCIEWLPACKHALLRRAPLLLVAALGTLIMARMLQVLPHRIVRMQLALALLVGLFAITIDQTGQPAALAVFEEGFEVLAEALILGVLLGLKPAVVQTMTRNAATRDRQAAAAEHARCHPAKPARPRN